MMKFYTLNKNTVQVSFKNFLSFSDIAKSFHENFITGSHVEIDYPFSDFEKILAEGYEDKERLLTLVALVEENRVLGGLLLEYYAVQRCSIIRYISEDVAVNLDYVNKLIDITVSLCDAGRGYSKDDVGFSPVDKGNQSILLFEAPPHVEVDSEVLEEIGFTELDLYSSLSNTCILEEDYVKEFYVYNKGLYNPKGDFIMNKKYSSLEMLATHSFELNDTCESEDNDGEYSTGHPKESTVPLYRSYLTGKELEKIKYTLRYLFPNLQIASPVPQEAKANDASLQKMTSLEGGALDVTESLDIYPSSEVPSLSLSQNCSVEEARAGGFVRVSNIFSVDSGESCTLNRFSSLEESLRQCS